MEKIAIDNENYPELLKKISNPPRILYFEGNLRKKELCFAIVGTRLCSDYGKQAALEISGGLSDAGLTIVSGLAPGIDTFAHKAAVEKNKRTIAVLGTGLDEKSIYPKENLGLAKRIVECGGCLISEYPPGTRAAKFTFPQRNRIISGLSLGVLVVEAKEKSGSLITANYALSQKRKLFAVPGPIYSSNCKGTNGLLKRGAKAVTSPEDILKELNLPFIKNDSSGTKEAPLQDPVLLALKEGSLYIDKIIEKTKLDAKTVAASLTVLEMEGKVRNLGGNIYSIRSN